jgi:hypothetical protein
VYAYAARAQTDAHTHACTGTHTRAHCGLLQSLVRRRGRRPSRRRPGTRQRHSSGTLGVGRYLGGYGEPTRYSAGTQAVLKGTVGYYGSGKWAVHIRSSSCTQAARAHSWAVASSIHRRARRPIPAHANAWCIGYSGGTRGTHKCSQRAQGTHRGRRQGRGEATSPLSCGAAQTHGMEYEGTRGYSMDTMAAPGPRGTQGVLIGHPRGCSHGTSPSGHWSAPAGRVPQRRLYLRPPCLLRLPRAPRRRSSAQPLSSAARPPYAPTAWQSRVEQSSPCGTCEQSHE